MMLFERVKRHEAALKRAGREEIEKAKLAGVPAYYSEASNSDCIVREMPDGTRQRVKLAKDGEEEVVEPIGPKFG